MTNKTTPAAKKAATTTTEAGAAQAPKTNSGGAEEAGETRQAPKQTRTYKVVSHLDHDGESFEPGAEVELTKKQAAPLLGHTVVEAGDDE